MTKWDITRENKYVAAGMDTRQSARETRKVEITSYIIILANHARKPATSGNGDLVSDFTLIVGILRRLKWTLIIGNSRF